MLCLYILVYYFLFPEVLSKKVEIKCPEHCKCDFFENLKRATCTNRNLAHIESNFPKQTQILDLSFNQIQDLDQFVFKEEQLVNLQLLNLSHNKVSHVHMRAFDGLSNLKTLDLSYNSIQYVLRNWFWGLKSIEELYLRGNNFNFNRLDVAPVFTTKSLKKLDISNCHTSYIAPNTFSEVPNLEILDISDNSLISLTTDVIVPLQNLQILNANNTQLSCNEDFKKLSNYCTHKGIRFIHPCAKKKNTNPEKFQKMINLAPPENEKNSWIYDDEDTKNCTETRIINVCNNTNEHKTLLQEIVNLSPVLSIVFPFVYGIGVGVLIAYLYNVCTVKQKTLNDNPPRRRPRMDRITSSFTRSRSTEETQHLPQQEWKLSESTPVLFRKGQNQVQF